MIAVACVGGVILGVVFSGGGGAIGREGGVEDQFSSVGVVAAGVAGYSSPAASGWQGCGSLGGRVREV